MVTRSQHHPSRPMGNRRGQDPVGRIDLGSIQALFAVRSAGRQVHDVVGGLYETVKKSRIDQAGLVGLRKCRIVDEQDINTYHRERLGECSLDKAGYLAGWW